MKTQVALRLEDSLVRLAKAEAERDHRSLANFVEVLLAEVLLTPVGSRPVLSLADAEDTLTGAVALDDDGNPDAEETALFRRLIAVADKGT
jgi:hypothetical protein